MINMVQSPTNKNQTSDQVVFISQHVLFNAEQVKVKDFRAGQPTLVQREDGHPLQVSCILFSFVF